MDTNQSKHLYLLKEPIEAIDGLSAEFKHTVKELGYQTLNDLLATRTAILVKQQGMSKTLIYEYVSFMEHNYLGRLVDP